MLSCKLIPAIKSDSVSAMCSLDHVVRSRDLSHRRGLGLQLSSSVREQQTYFLRCEKYEAHIQQAATHDLA